MLRASQKEPGWSSSICCRKAPSESFVVSRWRSAPWYSDMIPCIRRQSYAGSGVRPHSNECRPHSAPARARPAADNTSADWQLRYVSILSHAFGLRGIETLRPCLLLFSIPAFRVRYGQRLSGRRPYDSIFAAGACDPRKKNREHISTQLAVCCLPCRFFLVSPPGRRYSRAPSAPACVPVRCQTVQVVFLPSPETPSARL